MSNSTDGRLQLRLMAEINKHRDPHEAARTVIGVAVFCALRSVGGAKTADFLRDAADYLEAHEFARWKQ